ncbi:MAG: choice-of-anchor L domain-containing protein [Bacteroidota bacterium]
MKKFTLLVLLCSLGVFAAKAQLVISPPSSYTQIVNDFILTGVSATNVVYTGDSNAIGTFAGGNTTNLGMNDGIILTTGVINGIPAIGDTASKFANTYNSQPGDALLSAILSYSNPTMDAAVLEFDLVPVGNILEFKYVFASEEYPEFAGSSFNDMFGFFISGAMPSGGNYINTNIALIPGTSTEVCINNINATTNSAYYVDNTGGLTVVFDGFTTVLTAQVNVIPSSTYHLKMALADVADGMFDSGIFLKTQSMKSYMIVGVDEYQKQNIGIAPNPVDVNSKLSVNLLHPGKVQLSITDISGKVVYTSQNNFDQGGLQQISLGQFAQNSAVGVYLLRLETNDFTQTQKLLHY